MPAISSVARKVARFLLVVTCTLLMLTFSPGDDGGHIAQETVAIVGRNLDRDRIRALTGAPRHFDQPFGLAAVYDVHAIAMMDHHTPAACHKADDGITRHRATALGELRQHAAGAAHNQVGHFRPGYRHERQRLFRRWIRFAISLDDFADDGLRTDVAGADFLEEIIHLFEVKQFHYRVVRHGVQAQAVHSRSTTSAARDVAFAILFLEPLLDLGACALRLDVAQVGIQPITAGTAALGGDDLHPIAVFNDNPTRPGCR